MRQTYRRDAAGWWERWIAHAANFEHPFEVAAACAGEQDRLAWVLASGYSGVLQAMFPTEHPVQRALCVTEEGGVGPSAVETRYDPDAGSLTGSKTIVTLAETADRFLVLAARGEDQGEWKDLVIVEVDAAADGVEVEPLELDFVPEISHGRVTFDEVAVTPDDVVCDHAWARAAKPFRLGEDVYVLGAVIAWFLQMTRRTGQADLTHRLLALLESARGLADPPFASSSAVAYAGLHALATETIDAFDWSDVADDVRKHWERDRALLNVAAGARRKRIELVDRKYRLTKPEEIERWTWKKQERTEGYVCWTDDGWLLWEEWQTVPRGAGAREEHRVSEFLRDGAPGWAPDDVVEKVRAAVESDSSHT